MTPGTWSWSAELAELQREAALKRTRGDALRRQGKENEARADFGAGVALLGSALQVLSDTWNRLPVQDGASSLSAEQLATADKEQQLDIAKEFVEVYGARGGLLRRLGESSAALDSYRLGARFERRLDSYRLALKRAGKDPDVV